MFMAGLSSLAVCVFMLVEIAQAQPQATTGPSEGASLQYIIILTALSFYIYKRLRYTNV